MKRTEKTVKAVSYVAGITAIAGAMLLVFLLVLSLVGTFHPRKVRIILYTPGISKIYDGTPLQGSAPELRGDSLHPGHTLSVTHIPEYTKVGVYPDAPVYVILDETGADVTNYYDITHMFGDITITPRPVQLFSISRSKEYDGEALTANPARLTSGSLAPGDTLVALEGNALLFPGKVQAALPYQIIAEDGSDVTDQYEVTESFGTLEVLPISLTLVTESAKKQYDGTPLSASGWENIAGKLLEGHHLEVEITASLRDVGTVENTGEARVLDAQGQDVSWLYQFKFQYGILEMEPVPLYVSTGSARKEYDGNPLCAAKWELTGGNLAPGEEMQTCFQTVHEGVGSVENVLQFSVTAVDGTDVTYRYKFICDYGTLTVEPRTISIRTGNAQKVYDGQPLTCETYTITRGSLVEGQQISISYTSITEVGYSDNYVLDCTIYQELADGTLQDVTDCYRIVYDFGTLKITAD